MSKEREQSLVDDPSFNESFLALFQKFLQAKASNDDARNFFETFQANQLGLLFEAVCALGGPERHMADDTSDVNGFFEFIDFVTALAYSCGADALREIQAFPDSPTNQHYIHYVKQYLGDDRFMKSILEKYPYCVSAD